MSESGDSLTQEKRRALESRIDEWFTNDRFVGASLALVDETGTIYAGGFGARDLAANAPATPETLYGVGSCTKPFTAFAVMQLVGRGELELSDPVADHTEFFTDAPGSPVTVADLLTHTSGLFDDGIAAALVTPQKSGSDVLVPLASRADVRRHVNGATERRKTGDDVRFNYYNSGYVVLARVVERVTDTPFAEYVTREILRPLGMDRTTFDADAFDEDPDAMTPYDDGESFTECSFPSDSLDDGAGGLVSSVTGLGSFLRALLNDGTVDGTELLDSELVRAMCSARVTEETYLDGSERHYGYGVSVAPVLGDTLVGHAGSIDVSNAYLGYLEDAGVGVAVAVNGSPNPHPSTVACEVLAILTDRDPVDTIPRFELAEKFEAVTGTYESYRGQRRAVVERDGGMLRVRHETNWGDHESVLVPESTSATDYAFYKVTENGTKLTVTFEQTDEGTVMNGARQRYRRQSRSVHP